MKPRTIVKSMKMGTRPGMSLLCAVHCFYTVCNLYYNQHNLTFFYLHPFDYGKFMTNSLAAAASVFCISLQSDVVFSRPYFSNGQAVAMVVVRLSVCLSQMYCG